MENQLTYLFAGASSAMALATAKLLQAQGHKVIGLTTKGSIAQYDTCIHMEKYNKASYPILDENIDGLVYFPGSINLKPFARFTEAEILTEFEINTLGALSFVQSYFPNLKKSSNGSIVFISSVAVAAGMPFHASVAISKGALESLTRSLAAELAPSIRVNCIAPSLTHTPLAEKFLNTPEKVDAMEKKNPMKTVGTPEDMANAIAFLLSPEARWINGQILAIDGGHANLKIN